MSYLEIFRRAWKNIWSGGSWGFVGTAYLAFLAAATLVVGVFLLFAGLSTFKALGGAPTTGRLPAEAITGIVAMVGLAFLLFIPLGVIFQGGLVFLSNELAEGRRARVGAGWSAGFRHFGSLLVVGLAIFFASLAAFLVAAAPLVLVFALSARTLSGVGSGGSGGLSEAVGACCCGGLLYLVWIAFALILQSWSELSMRHVVIGGRGAGDALGTALRDLRGRFRRTFLLALALFGITFAISIVTGLISVPFDSLASSDSRTLSAVGGLISVVVSLISVFVSLALTLFQASSWTLYYRSFTGTGGSIESGVASGGPVSYDGASAGVPAPPAYSPPTPPVTAEPAPPAPPAYAPPAPPAPPAYAPPSPPVSAEPTATAEAPIVDVEVPAAGEPTEESPPADV